MEELQIGDTVLLSRESEFRRQAGEDEEGIILSQSPRDGWFTVRWTNSGRNSYRSSDLILVSTDPEELAKREAERLARLEKERKQFEELEGTLKAALDDWYGDRYDLQVSGKEHVVIVHYPEILITSEDRRTHTITDLYVRFTLRDGKMQHRLEGWRGSYSKAEVMSGYAHSHLSGLTSGWSGFCLGMGEIIEVMGNLAREFNEDNLYLLLHSLDNYVKWESISGRPYKYIRNISKRDRGLYNLHNYDLDNGYTLFKRFLRTNSTSIPLTFNKVKGRFEYLMDDAYLAAIDSIEGLTKTKRSVDRSTYYANSSTEVRSVSRWYIEYKGEKVFSTVNSDVEVADETVECSHPDYYPYIIDKLNSDINDKYLKQASDDSYSKVERIISIQFPEATPQQQVA